MQYFLKLKSNPDNPTHKVAFDPVYEGDLQRKETFIARFNIRYTADINCLDFDLEDVAKHKNSDIPMWMSKSPTFLAHLSTKCSE